MQTFLLNKSSSYRIMKLWHTAFSSITSLFFACCPPAISRFIISIIVNTFQSITEWTRAYIFVELAKRFQPIFANSNSPTAIPFISPIIGICTSLFYICPCMIFRFTRKSLCFVVWGATAGLFSTALQIITSYYYDNAAIAFTFKSRPASCTDNIGRTPKHNKMPISLSGSIYEFHNANINILPFICQGRVA